MLQERRDPKTFWLGILQRNLLWLYITSLAFLGIRATNPPRLSIKAPPASEFSTERAIQPLKIIASHPHPLGSAAHDSVRDFLLGKWKELGFSPEMQQAKIVDINGNEAQVSNIIVRLRGSVSPKAVMIVAHYDSTDRSPGAADDGAGIAVMLETGRALKSSSPLKNDIIFLMTDGEEQGCLGAKLFVREHTWAKDVGVVLNLEARGSSGLAIMFESSDGNAQLINDFIKSVPFPFASSLAPAIYERMPYTGDMSVFKSAGIQGLNFAFIAKSFIHSPKDTLDNLDLRSIQHMGTSALALVRYLGSISLPEKSPQDAIFFNIFGSFIVSYPEWVSMLCIVLLGAMLVTAGVAGLRRKTIQSEKIALGILIYSGNIVLFICLASFFPKTGARIIAIGISYLMIRFSVSKLSRLQQAFSSSVIWTLLAASTAIALPKGSYLFVWPAFFSFIPLFWRLRFRENPTPTWKDVLSVMLGITPVILLFAPSLYIFFTALRPHLLVVQVSAGIAAQIFWCTLPALKSKRTISVEGLPNIL